MFEAVKLEKLKKQTLIELCRMYSRNWQTLDGLWFGNVEAEFGLEVAVKLDLKNWEKQAVLEAKRIKKVLKLEGGGPTAVLTVLSLMSWQLASPLFKIESESQERIIFCYSNCAVQEGREKHQKRQFACKPMKLTLLSSIAAVVDPKVMVNCLSCPPDTHPPGYWCRWELKRSPF